MYKSTFGLYCLFPEFNNIFDQDLSIFDKAYQLQLIEHCFLHKTMDDVSYYTKLKIPKLMDFEIEAWKLLRDGGTKNKPFKVIQDASKVIRDQIDS